MKPRVFVDCRWLGHTGLGRYVDCLFGALTQIDHGLSIVAGVLNDLAEPPTWLHASDVDVVTLKSKWFTFSEQVELPRAVRRIGAHLTHYTNFNVPVAQPGPFVTTVHDLTLLDHPTAGAAWLERVRTGAKSVPMRVVLRRALKRSRCVLVPSRYVGDELATRLHVSEARIAITREAPVALADPGIEILGSLGVRQPFVLTAGKAYPHKNLVRLLDAIDQLAHDRVAIALVLVGPEDSHRAELRAQVEQRGLGSCVSVLGHVSETELAALLRSARCYIVPSIAEGFGLPGLEAMSVGTPVVSSNSSCLPEVYGNAALFFDPLDVDDMAAKLALMWRSPDLREELARAGRMRAGEFSWANTAAATLDAYRRALVDA